MILDVAAGVFRGASTPVPGDNGYYAPMQYSVLWPILGLVLLGLVVVWYVWMIRHVRRRAKAPETPAFVPPSTEVLRSRFFGLIDQIEGEYASGAVTSRIAHQQLGRIVRMYAQESRGVRAQVMTLDDLNRAELFPVAQAVSAYYPAEFRELESGSVRDAAAIARGVVDTWR